MRITRFLSGSALNLALLKPLVTLVTFSLLATACGGGGGGGSKSSSSSSTFSYSYSSASLSSNGTGVWPSIQVDAPLAKTLSFSWSEVEGASYYKLMKNQGGTSGFVQVGENITGTSTTEEIAVHLQDWINTRYLVQWCDENNVCQDSDNTYTATEMLKSIGKIRASNADANDLFGWSLALSGDGQTLAVGAPAEDSNARGVNGDQTSNNSQDSGAVYVFVKQDGLWVQQAYLKASNTEQPSVNPNRILPNDRFGYKVAISDDGNTLAVSAIHEDSPSWGVNCNQDNYELTLIRPASSTSNSSLDANDISINAANMNVGAVYLFKRTDSQWNQTAYIKPEYPRQNLLFGQTLSISGDGKTLAVGTAADALTFDIDKNITHFSQSSVRECLMYENVDQASFSSSETSSSSSSSSIAKSSSSQGAYGGKASGAVYIFTETENGWLAEAFIKPAFNQIDDQFGSSTALSTDGNTLVAGAIGEDSKATGVNGDAKDNSCFENLLDEYNFDPDCSTRYRTLMNSGAAYIFVRSNGVWTQQAFLKPATPWLNANFGSAVAISGDATTVAVGAVGDGSAINQVINSATIEDKNSMNHLRSGAAYIFVYDGSSWAQQAFIKPEVNLSGYEFGNLVKLAQEGNLLAVGTHRESSNSQGINGNPGDQSTIGAGAMYIFIRENNQWRQESYVKASDTEAQDRFGTAADLSNDGKTMAVGAYRKSGQASSEGASTEAGAVYLY
jgi:hypothetical protein